MRERILVAGELEAEIHGGGGGDSEWEREEMVFRNEQEDKHYLGWQTSSVVNSSIWENSLQFGT